MAVQLILIFNSGVVKMQTNEDLNKSVIVIGFSICGVGGFQTVAASGSNCEKRITSAINQMDRDLKQESKELTRCVDNITAYMSEERDQLCAKSEQVNHVLRILTTVKDQFVVQQDESIFSIDDDPLTILSTEQFFANSHRVYAENVSTFIEHLDEIENNLNAHIAKRKAEGAKKTRIGDLIPRLYICDSPKAGLFHDEKFYLFLTNRDVYELSGSDYLNYDLAVRNFCFNRLQSVKNFKLTDYLRVAPEKREWIKADIEFIDREFDRLDNITVEQGGNIVGGYCEHNSKIAATRAPEFKKVGVMLKMESEIRLMDHILALLPSSLKRNDKEVLSNENGEELQ